MRISTRGRYGLRLMIELGMSEYDKPTPLGDIAQRLELSGKYLEQIVNQLHKAGLVRSIRGSLGGYILASPPEEINVGAILRVLEGALVNVSCMELEAECERKGRCPTFALWMELNDAVNGVVDNKTLADLITLQRELNVR